ncbi:MAG TPA: sugar transferase [Dehalococcoidia bacterium]|nr:sugar transferase [Dehalococcoidia bacterium]
MSAVVAMPLPTRRAGTYLPLKRALDATVAVMALACLAPLWGAIALAIALDSPGGILFRQRRVGRGGRLFTMYKFRTMHVDADDALHRQAVARWAQGTPCRIDGRPAYKPERDPRVTRVGRLLRLTGLDELPQLLNVLRGDMSLVGPRPAIPYELEHYRPWYRRRFQVRPGITGLWQVNRHRAPSLEEAMALDVVYVRRMSLRLDLQVLARTVPLVLGKRLSF